MSVRFIVRKSYNRFSDQVEYARLEQAEKVFRLIAGSPLFVGTIALIEQCDGREDAVLDCAAAPPIRAADSNQCKQ